MKVRPMEWIRKPDANADGLLKVELTDMEFGVPVGVETHNVSEKEVTMDQEQEFEMILESTGQTKVYRDPADYEARPDGHMAPESIIPCGLFPAGREDPSFEPDATVIIHGTVTKLYDDPAALGFSEDEFLYSMNCLGVELDVVASKNEITETITPGSIVSDVYWIQGWPVDNS